MDVSTIDPVTARELADGARADGHRFVACPLGKGPAQAEAGELPLFVGGDPAAIEELADVFACIGEQVHASATSRPRRPSRSSPTSSG